jgi:hypothetical protein
MYLNLRFSNLVLNLIQSKNLEMCNRFQSVASEMLCIKADGILIQDTISLENICQA